jgi:cytidylate kinase
MAVITISRQMGAGGRYIAAKVAEGFGYELVDSTLILKVAEQVGVSIDYALSHDEYYESRAYRWLKSIITPNIGKIVLEEKKHHQPESYCESLKKIIIELAEKNKIIIVGRASQFILKDRDNAFHVQIIAEMDTRIQRLMQKERISRSEAFKKIKNSDRKSVV